MNVYDFDKTIYDGDSTVNFFKYCIRRRPRVLLSLPRTVWFGLRFKLGSCEKTRFKEQFYRFLHYVDDIDGFVSDFWSKNSALIKDWYLDQKESTDVIISASPEFLLEPICRSLGIALMASRVDAYTGIYTGVNCSGAEKVRRFKEAYPCGTIDSFYSDSHSDDPLAEIAKKAFMVKGSKIIEWRS